MLLRPKQTKFKKVRKGRLQNIETRSSQLRFGRHGLKALTSGRISSRQIEAARQSITRRVKRKGRLWIRVFPDTPITKKPNEIRMGKGKGAVDYWAAKVAPGQVLFELDGVPEVLAREALGTGASKLSVRAKTIQRY